MTAHRSKLAPRARATASARPRSSSSSVADNDARARARAERAALAAADALEAAADAKAQAERAQHRSSLASHAVAVLAANSVAVGVCAAVLGRLPKAYVVGVAAILGARAVIWAVRWT